MGSGDQPSLNLRRGDQTLSEDGPRKILWRSDSLRGRSSEETSGFVV